jgi:nucleoside-diphosphate-sugar epimerase
MAEAFAVDHEVVVTGRRITPARAAWLAENSSLRSAIFDSSTGSEIPVDGHFDAVVNLAVPGAEETAADPGKSSAASMHLAGALARMVRENQIGRLIHFSSFHVYGRPVRDFYPESSETRPESPYGRNHLRIEQMLLSLGSERVTIVRPANIVAAPAHADLGPQAKLLFLSLTAEAVRNRTLTMINDGLSYRDFIPFEAVMQAMTILLARPSAPTGTVNLSGGTATRLDGFARAMQSAAYRSLGFLPSLSFGHGVDSFRRCFSVESLTLKGLGWHPVTDLADEMSAALRFFAAAG